MPGVFRIILTFFLISFNRAVDLESNNAKDTLEATHGKIIHTSVIFRHGDRTPEYTYPTDPYPSSMWSEGLGQLNNNGKLRMYNLGKWFRERYLIVPGLSQGYRRDTLLMNSSDYDRTLMSAEDFLAGFLPPNEDEMWASDGLKWQPIPVHTKPTAEDSVIAQERRCERYDLEKYNANQLPEIKESYRENQKLLEFIANNSGYSISSNDVFDAMNKLGHVYDTLKVEDEYNLTLPSWTNGIYPEPMNLVFVKMLVTYVFTPEMRILHAGPILKCIVWDMLQKQSGSFNQSFHLYSGHEKTIVSVLYTLGLFEFVAPSYGASIIFELRLKETEYVVTILYRNSTETGPYLLTLAECGYICTLGKFVEITKPWIPDNFDEECKVGWLEKLVNKSVITILIVLLLLLIVAVLAYVIVRCVRRRSSANSYIPI